MKTISSTCDRHRILPAAALLLTTALAAGCACTFGFRFVQVEATVDWMGPEEGTFGTFIFTVSEKWGTHLPDRYSIGWDYNVEVNPESLAVVQIRQGPGPVGGAAALRPPDLGRASLGALGTDAALPRPARHRGVLHDHADRRRPRGVHSAGGNRAGGVGAAGGYP